jgi:hypothetical protein
MKQKKSCKITHKKRVVMDKDSVEMEILKSELQDAQRRRQTAPSFHSDCRTDIMFEWQSKKKEEYSLLPCYTYEQGTGTEEKIRYDYSLTVSNSAAGLTSPQGG